MPDVHSTDLAINYKLPVWKIQFFGVAEMTNVFDNDELGDVRFVNTNVITRRTGGASSGLQTFNPKTQTPVEGTHYRLDPNFGKASSFSAYQTPRTYRFAFGLRF